jgi:hypothetical protein
MLGNPIKKTIPGHVITFRWWEGEGGKTKVLPIT